jgi:hypothetical protein
VLRLPPPAKKSPAIVAKPMTRGAIRFTIAAMYNLRWFGSGRSPANALASRVMMNRLAGRSIPQARELLRPNQGISRALRRGMGDPADPPARVTTPRGRLSTRDAPNRM